MDNKEIELFSQHLTSRASFSTDQIQQILDASRDFFYKKGKVIVNQGDINTQNIFVLSGALKTFHTDIEGNQHVVAFAIKDWWVGDLASFISQKPSDYSIECLEDCRVLKFSVQEMNRLMNEIPYFERFYRLLVQKAYVHAQKRIINNFSLSAKDRYKLFLEKYPQFVDRIPQYLIASYLGITKEFLSKIKKDISYE
jgi:CRP-like cAMP-binding protein